MLEELPLAAVIGLFVAAAAVVAILGVRLTGLADRLADRTGFGEAIVGGVLLGAVTSLAGAAVSVSAALDGRAALAFSNGVGGIAAQTAFLAIADVVHRRANLEHASAELANIFQAGLLMLILSMALIGFTSPDLSILAIHPISLAMLVVYIAGMRGSAMVRADPMWKPVSTPETREDAKDEDESGSESTIRMAVKLAAFAAVLGLCGYVLAKTGGRISDSFGISETTVGALLTAVATSLPELVTTLAAVRRGALQLAVGGIIGGNAFDCLFLTLSDIFYREGSLYHAVGRGELFWLSIGLAMTAILMLGLIMREKRGVGNIGFESIAMIGLYLGAVVVQAAWG